MLTDNESKNDESKKLKVEYLHKRLDHTLSFTFTITKLMYLVNGAGLAFVYFAFSKDSGLSNPGLIGLIVSWTLAILNLVHANFIFNQHIWHRVDSELLEKETKVSYIGNQYKAKRKKDCRRYTSWVKSSHGTFWWFHIVTAIALFILGIFLLMETCKTGQQDDTTESSLLSPPQQILGERTMDNVLYMIGVFILASAAIFGPPISERIKRKWFAPKLKIYFEEVPPTCRKTTRGNEFPTYYFCFKVKNVGKTQAKKCEAVVENLLKADDSGNFPYESNYKPLNLNWGAGQGLSVNINPDRWFYCGLLEVPSPEFQKSVKGYINPPGIESFNTGAILCVNPSLFAQPNRLPEGKYRIDIAIYPENANSVKESFYVTWSGEWKDEQEDMFSELVIQK